MLSQAFVYDPRMSLFAELKRRNVFRVAIAYLITAWLLIQLADILIPMLTLPEWVPRLIVLLLIILLIPTLIAAWALELTPDGLKLEKHVDRSISITTHTGKKLNSITIGILALAVVVLLVDKLYLSADSSRVETVTIEKSIAVLPFADLSEGQDQEWFADGLAEEILNALSRTPDLLVASRTSAFAYKGSVKDLRVIAKELGVAHILEGSVRRVGERLRVTAQLIRASDGFHLWSENYDRDAADVIEVQEDLAVKIASAMQTTMDPKALRDMLRVGTQSVEAYQAYLRGIALFAKAGATDDDDAFLASYDMYEQARSLDPDFSTAHHNAAFFWAVQSSPTTRSSGLTDATAEEISRNYLARVNRAIDTAENAIDQQGLEAEKALYELRLRRALSLYKGYLEERPRDLEAWGAFQSVAAYLSDKQSSLTALQQLKIEGESRVQAATYYLGAAYRIIDASEAADYGLQALQRWPDDNSLMYQLHRTLLWAGRTDEAAALAQRLTELHGYDPMVQARQACMEGRVQDVLDILTTERARDGDPDNIVWLILLLLDDKESAEAIPHFYESSENLQALASWLVYHKFDPGPFPSLMAVLERENVDRPPPAEMPYTCSPNAL
jgi:TolB-like protein